MNDLHIINSPRVIWKPQPRQEAFLKRPEYEVLYGGAAGGGKSDALLMWVLEPQSVPHYQGILFRKTYPELEEIINRSLDLYPKIIPGARFNDNKHVWRFPSGARVYLGSMHQTKDVLRYQGRSFSRVGFDELTHFTFQEYSYMFSRNRPNGPGLIPQMRGATNPGGIGHVWTKGRFIDGRIPEQSYVSKIVVNGKEYLRHKCFVPATVFDNQILLENDPNYVASMAMLPEATRKALLEGSWDSFNGQAFVEWRDRPDGYRSRQWSHVVEPFKIPDNWRIFRSFDFGYSRPFSVIWYAMDNDGRMYCVRELYGTSGVPNEGCKWHPSRIAQEIKRIEAEEFKGRGAIRGIADPSIWDGSRGESIAIMMEHDGVYWTPGDNKRIPGKQQVHWRLAFDAEGYPMLYVFRTCRHVIRTLPSLVYDPVDVEDIDSDGEDHCLTGDTNVITSDGLIPISELPNRPDVMVYGPDGLPKAFNDARLTKHSTKVVSIALSNGITIKCTPDHRFMMPGGTWIKACDMTENTSIKSVSVDMTQLDTEVMICKSRLSVKLYRNLMERGSTNAGYISSTEVEGCTEPFGNITKGKLLKDIIFTILMETLRTMISAIYGWKRLMSILKNTPIHLRTRLKREIICLKSCTQRVQSGINQTKESPGTPKTPRTLGRIESRKSILVPTVESPSVRQIDIPKDQTTSAIRTVNSGSEIEDCARVLSVSDGGIADVYNIHVPDGNAYLLEGGIVTHNCYDSLRYMMMDHPIPPRSHTWAPIVTFDPLNQHKPKAETMFIHM